MIHCPNCGEHMILITFTNSATGDGRWWECPKCKKMIKAGG